MLFAVSPPVAPLIYTPIPLSPVIVILSFFTAFPLSAAYIPIPSVPTSTVPVLFISAIFVYIPIEESPPLDFPLTVIVPALFIVMTPDGVLLPFIAAIPFPPDSALMFPVLVIFLSAIVPTSYLPRSAVPPSPIVKFPDEVKSPFTVAASDPEPVTVMLFPNVRVPPSLYTPVPPPVPKLNVRFPVVPRLAVPPLVTYTPTAPLLILNDELLLSKVVPVFTYIPTAPVPAVVIVPPKSRVVPDEPCRYIPTPSFAFTVTLFTIYVPCFELSNSIPTDVLPSFTPGPVSGMLAPVSITAPLNLTLLSST